MLPTFLCSGASVSAGRAGVHATSTLHGLMRQLSRLLTPLSLASVFLCSGNAQAPRSSAQDLTVHLNQIQVIGSHNSYHSGIAPSERKLIEQQNPKAMRALDYEHPPMAEQLDHGVRQLEIDVYADTQGGRYAHPAIVGKVADAGLPVDPDFDPNHEMLKPGFKVMHVLDVDQRSSCHLFTSCLQGIRAWSKRHPGHLPVFILVETKQGRPGTQRANGPEPFTAATFDALDAEILSVFSRSEIVTPDQVRGDYDSLSEAVQMTGKSNAGRHGGWPTLAESRGKIVFLLDQRPVTTVYTEGHTALRGRVLFTNAVPGTPDAAFTEENSGTKEEIDSLARQGYLIRTRSDDGTEEARVNNHARADVALASGAQMVSTDYPPGEPSRWTGFLVGLPQGQIARCNPVTAPAGCRDALLEPATK